MEDDLGFDLTKDSLDNIFGAYIAVVVANSRKPVAVGPKIEDRYVCEGVGFDKAFDYPMAEKSRASNDENRAQSLTVVHGIIAVLGAQR